jgi:hypothetical protein
LLLALNPFPNGPGEVLAHSQPQFGGVGRIRFREKQPDENRLRGDSLVLLTQAPEPAPEQTPHCFVCLTPGYPLGEKAPERRIEEPSFGD